MPRMWDITKFIIIAEITIGFIAGLNLFEVQTFHPIQGGVTDYTVGDLDAQISDRQSGSINYFDLAVALVFSGLNILLSIFKAVVVIFLVLVDDFHIPAQIAVVLQALIYLEYSWFIAQWIAGRPGGTYS